MGRVLSSPVFWNLVTLAIIVGFAWAIVRARKQPLWAEAFRRLRDNRLAIGSLVVVLLYVTVGVLDSITWRDNRISDARSVIDRVFERPKERTYSAPFAKWTTGEPKPHRV